MGNQDEAAEQAEYQALRFATDPIEAFNLFVKRNVDPSLHPNFADSDSNEAEYVRRAIRAAIDRAALPSIGRGGGGGGGGAVAGANYTATVNGGGWASGGGYAGGGGGGGTPGQPGVWYPGAISAGPGYPGAGGGAGCGSAPYRNGQRDT